MAVVADSVNPHLFTTPTHASSSGDYGDYRRARSATSRSRTSTPPDGDRLRDVAHTFVPMSRSTGSQQSQRSTPTPTPARPHTSAPAPAHGPDASSSTAAAAAAAADDDDNHETASSSTVSLPAPHPSPGSPHRVQVRDLSHIQSLAAGGTSSRRAGDGTDVQYEISSMPIEHIIEMVAGLLTKITTANDMQHEHLHAQVPAPDSSSGAGISPQTSSVLAFHGKNVPSITILSYLHRINKYCPTSYEVFLSLLVYFDRMTRKVNSAPMQSLKEQQQQQQQQQKKKKKKNTAKSQDSATNTTSTTTTTTSNTTTTTTTAATSPDRVRRPEPSTSTEPVQTATPPASGNLDTADQKGVVPGTPHSKFQDSPPAAAAASSTQDQDLNLSHFFVVDSFNIHRLVIAGVTCASKFFSDIFYTNSRYAKVGGLPLPELNHLELQFLLLNDFRLQIPVEELEAYGTMLVEFYAREVLDPGPTTPMQLDPVPPSG